MKTCPRCKTEKPHAEFYGEASGRLSSHCRECQIARSRARWSAKKTEIKASNRAYYQSHKSKWLAAARALRARVLAAYGGACKCCGEETPEFLAIDHVNNDGESHRREVLKGYGRAIYRWLEKSGYPQDRFQLLCHNCNMAKGLYGGCPHAGPVPGRRQSTTRWSEAAN